MKNDLRFTGVVVDIRPIQEFASAKDASKSYKKQEIVIEEENEQHPNSILLEVFGDLEKLEGIAVGDNVEAIYNTKARSWEKNGKSGVMGTNSIWKIVKNASAAPFVSAAEAYPTVGNAATGVGAPPATGEDGLPF